MKPHHRIIRQSDHNTLANANDITPSDEARAQEIEAFRSGLIMELIELEIEMTAKDAVLRLVRNFRRQKQNING